MLREVTGRVFSGTIPRLPYSPILKSGSYNRPGNYELNSYIREVSSP